ncbi:MAG TPA: hypothetical protein VFG59_11405 [Anaeromyxobacter sp.]|nr:hypothetical protein [Anaeromyxobacter sp.]
MILQVAIGLFALYMLVRYVPPASRTLRRRGLEDTAGRSLIPLLNVLLAVVLLALAVKGVAGALIRK